MNLNGLLEQAHQPLPPDITATDEQILIAGTPRRTLKAAINEAGGAASAAQLELEVSGLALESASEACAASSAFKNLDPTVEVAVWPNVDELKKLGELIRQVTAAHKVTRQQHNVMQSQLELSRRTRREARRLSRVPQAILAVVTTALISGAAIHDEQVLHDGAKATLASGTVQAGTKDWVRDEENASNSQRDITDAYYVGGATLSGGAVWLLVGDRPARPRARWIMTTC